MTVKELREELECAPDDMKVAVVAHGMLYQDFDFIKATVKNHDGSPYGKFLGLEAIEEPVK